MQELVAPIKLLSIYQECDVPKERRDISRYHRVPETELLSLICLIMDRVRHG
ncbi:hypothetical protein CYLTODRAFT_460531 [Cylindrobasidium torrendii FP15055 ss-10]|uniref:Uncharacterized protein n=1 Tax=Cylindrobasidium torrendii FP15055 ss-10 TaxID=1314674 RepID=A0A0D7ARQ8_9AGAR|nr:hypothetical protein CYLTODRAFT_460531 [Cylindrobasidium torrendii FP15055 ss-10]